MIDQFKFTMPRVYEPDEDIVHYEAPFGLDQVTLCGLTDWLGQTRGKPTKKKITCRHCQAVAKFVANHIEDREGKEPE